MTMFSSAIGVQFPVVSSIFETSCTLDTTGFELLEGAVK